MQLSDLIAMLLKRRECVTIPGFGAFLTQQVSAKISEEEDFLPPTKTVGFNSLLTSNDGLLANFLSSKTQVSYEKAVRLIEKEVAKWKKMLKTHPIKFAHVGQIRLNEVKKMEFIPKIDANFDTKSFGLKPFKKKPVNQIIKPEKNIVMDNEEKDDILFTPDALEDSDSTPPYARYAIIALIFIGLALAGYYFYDEYYLNKKSTDTIALQEKIKSNVQNATFNLGELTRINFKLNGSSTKETFSNTLRADGSIYYSVIAGSFRSVKNAENKLQLLKKEGYEKASLVSVNPVGFHRVAYGRFKNKKKAIELLYFLKYTMKEDAWYLVEDK